MINLSQNIKLQEVTTAELEKISSLTTPQDALALIHIPEETLFAPECLKGKFTLVLDGIQDPGNLGTIIRTADWFGFTQLVCSTGSVDRYNPKVVQATMGSLARVTTWYLDLEIILNQAQVPVYAGVMNGSSLYETAFSPEGVLLLGNEGNGISSPLMASITHPLTIPRFGGAESLNVAVAAAIICSEIKRQT